MAVDIKKLFNEEIPAGLEKNAEEAKTIAAKYQINITGEGEWFVDASATGPSCKPGTGEAADCTITIAADDFQKLVSDPNQGMQLFFQGKLKVAGNPMLAQKLQKLFAYAK
jgi:putative sterol carrier protein